MDFVPQWIDGATSSTFLPTAGSAGYGADVLAADALLADPRLELATVHAHWAELTAPGTPSSRLFELAGMNASGFDGSPASLDDASACP